MLASSNAHEIRGVLGSLALHAALFYGLSVGVRELGVSAQVAPKTTAAWSGDTFDVSEVARVEPEPHAESVPESTQPANAAPSEPTPKPAAPSETAPSEPTTPRPVASANAGDTPAPPRTPPAASARAAAQPAASPNASGAAVASTPGNFGMAGSPPGVRSLPGAFTRAIVPATRADASWQGLPLGPAGVARVLIEVDDSGKIVRAEPDPREHGEAPLPAHLQRLLDRTVMLLGAGTFALSARAGAGTEKLSIAVELSQRAASEDSGPDHVTEQGQLPPTPSRPGRAYFTLGSGRHFEARVTIVRD